MRISRGPNLGQRPPSLGRDPAPPAPPGRAAAQVLETVAGGTALLTGSIIGSYTGALGGAAVGTAVGLGWGPMWGAMTSLGAGDFLSASFHGLGLAARAGIVIGGTTGLVGGATLGWRAAGLLGKALGSGTKENAPAEQEPLTGLASRVEKGIAGTGFLSGAVGGFAAGAGLAVANNFLQGLAWNSGLIGAGVMGAGVMGVVGAVGASQLVRGARWSGRQAKAGWQKLQPTLEMIHQSPHRRVIYGAALGATGMGLLGAGIHMGPGVAVASALMGAGLGAAAGFISQQR